MAWAADCRQWHGRPTFCCRGLRRSLSRSLSRSSSSKGASPRHGKQRRGSLTSQLIDGSLSASHVHDEMVPILVADLVGSTQLSATMDPESCVKMLSDIFSAFDFHAALFGLHRSKLVGDCYVVTALPKAIEGDSFIERLEATADLGLSMSMEMEGFREVTGINVSFRMGLAIGSVSAGLMGVHRYSWDVWGQGVARAAEMERTSSPGRVQVHEDAKRLLESKYVFEAEPAAKALEEIDERAFFLIEKRNADVGKQPKKWKVKALTYSP